MKSVAVFGSTGSIGKQTVSVCKAYEDSIKVSVLVFGSNISLGWKQIEEVQPDFVGVFDHEAAKRTKERYPHMKVVSGADVFALAAENRIDIVVNGVSGFTGVHPLLYALNAGKKVALANKESIVCAGSIVRDALKTGGGSIFPVDSEQSAIFQCLSAGIRADVKSLILTASGGAFREFSIEELQNVTPEMAMRHPNWSMGKKITIDSATLFNKGLEIMEAAFLFDMQGKDIKVLIHPQSVVHSMVEYKDGAVMAQLGIPDMRLAIQYALTYPERWQCESSPLDLAKYGSLTFLEPDMEKFPALPMAYAALDEGGALPIAYNSANEIAVERFIHGDLRFTDIPRCVEYVMRRIGKCDIARIDELIAVDTEVRRLAAEYDRL